LELGNTTFFGQHLDSIYLMSLNFVGSGLSDQDAIRFNISLADKSDLLEEILTELSVYFGMLYHLIEVFKGHEDFAEELSQSLSILLSLLHWT